MSLTFAAALLIAAAPPSPATNIPNAPLILDRNRPDRAPVAPPAATDAPATPQRGKIEIEAEASGAPIRHIAFRGTRVPAKVAAAAQRFVGKPASKAVLTALAQAMSDAYAKTDVALYTVLVPQQSLAEGNVRIAVIEGYIERIAYTSPASPLIKAYATALAAEKPLTKHTLQRYLSLMRDLPGATIDIQLLRGSKPGAVVLQIGAKRKAHEFAVGFDNQGIKLLGTSQAHADAHLYNLLRDGDRTDISGIASPDFHRLLYISGSHTTPIGDSGATLGGAVGYISTHPRDGAADGTAFTFGLTGAYPLIRGYTKNLTLTLGVDGIDSDAAVLGTLLSSDHTRAVRGAAGYSQTGTKTVLTAGLTVSRGLGILGARGTPGFTDTLFTKLNGRITYDRQLTPKIFVHLRAAGQYSQDKLAAVERFAVGGPDFGRAFDQALLSGDKGAAGSGELAFRPKLPAKLAGSELYGFVDYATIGIVARPPYLAGDFDLASAGAGVRLAYDNKGSIGLEGARAIDDPYPGYRGNWRVNVSWRLALARH